MSMYHWESDQEDFLVLAGTVDEAALRHGAGVVHDTTDADQAYARFPKRAPLRYRDGWLPD
jgi:hypothetical protein